MNEALNDNTEQEFNSRAKPEYGTNCEQSLPF